MKMIINKKINITQVIAIIILLVSTSFSFVFADTMTSSSYKIQSDSVNFGGVRSASGAYTMEDTLGEVATGLSSSTNYTMSAGYQQMQAVYISVTSASNVTLSPAIGGVTGGIANGATSFTVTTDNPAGYSANIQASSSPALVSATDNFADYVPAGANPDFSFTNAANASSFAFSPEGTDIYGRYKNNGGACNAGSNTSGGCWDGLSTIPKTILERTSSNHPSGVLATLNFRAASGASHIQQDGVYVATTTITVVPL
jgi:hypothetical protein